MSTGQPGCSPSTADTAINTTPPASIWLAKPIAPGARSSALPPNTRGSPRWLHTLPSFQHTAATNTANRPMGEAENPWPAASPSTPIKPSAMPSASVRVGLTP